MKRLISIIFILFLCVPGSLLSLQTGSTARLTREQESWLKSAERYEKNGWIYLHIEGEPRQRGFQHGYLLAKEIAEALRVHRALWKHESGMEWDWLVEKSKAMFTPKVDQENLADIDGIVEGLAAAGVKSTRDEIIAYNGWFDLKNYWWPEEKKKVGAQSPNPPKQSCSSFIATGKITSNGGIVLAHNSMISYPEATYNLVLDIVPARGHRILMQAIPGWVHSGTDFFITDAGLVGSETTIGEFSGFDEKQVPEFVRMRRATQDASSIDEWAAIMKRGNNGGYANAWLIGDTKTNEIARLELGLKYVGFEKTKDGFFIGSNIAEDLRILRLETDTHSDDIRESNVARRVRWKQLMKQHAGKIDVELAKSFIADHFDPYLLKTNPGSRTLCAHAELDPQQVGGSARLEPFLPAGTFDGKVVDSAMAKRMAFTARWGSACGMPFNAAQFLEAHPQFDWMAGLLKDRPTQPWTEFRADSPQGGK
jgi:hypothetical protein